MDIGMKNGFLMNLAVFVPPPGLFINVFFLTLIIFVLSRIKEISFPYGDEANMCQKCGEIHTLQALRKGKKTMRCTECKQGKPGDIKKIMFFKIKVSLIVSIEMLFYLIKLFK